MGKRMIDVLDELVPGDATPGELLRACRKRDGFTLSELSQITGIQETNLSAIENDRIEITQHYAEIFGAALDVHPVLFLYRQGRFKMSAELKAIAKRGAKLRSRTALKD